MQLDSEDLSGPRKQASTDKRYNITDHSTDSVLRYVSAKVTDRETTTYTDDEFMLERNRSSNDEGNPTLRDLLRQLQETYGTLSRRRNDQMLLQTQTATEISTYRYKRKFAEDSILQLLATFSEQREEEMKSVPQQTIQSLKAQLVDDGLALESQSQIAMEVESRNSNNQFKVAESETLFMVALKELILNMPGGSELWTDMDTMAVVARQKVDNLSEATDEIPELAQKYFEAAGNVYIIREQLMESHQQHIDERAMRDFMRDQGDIPAMLDSIFESEYESKQAALKERLEEAMRLADQAKRTCDDHGIDVEALRHRNRSDTDDFKEVEAPKAMLPLFMGSAAPQLLPNGSPLVGATEVQEDVEPPGAVEKSVRHWLAASLGPELEPDIGYVQEDLRTERIVSRQEKIREENKHALRRCRSDTALDIGT